MHYTPTNKPQKTSVHLVITTLCSFGCGQHLWPSHATVDDSDTDDAVVDDSDTAIVNVSDLFMLLFLLPTC